MYVFLFKRIVVWTPWHYDLGCSEATGPYRLHASTDPAKLPSSCWRARQLQIIFDGGDSGCLEDVRDSGGDTFVHVNRVHGSSPEGPDLASHLPNYVRKQEM
jgi:hypothetical protein